RKDGFPPVGTSGVRRPASKTHLESPSFDSGLRTPDGETDFEIFRDSDRLHSDINECRRCEGLIQGERRRPFEVQCEPGSLPFWITSGSPSTSVRKSGWTVTCCPRIARGGMRTPLLSSFVVMVRWCSVSVSVFSTTARTPRTPSRLPSFSWLGMPPVWIPV